MGRVSNYRGDKFRKKIDSWGLLDTEISYKDLTSEQKETWDSSINDTGRNFAPIVGGIFSIIYFIFIIIFTTIMDIIYSIYMKIKKK
ncbi:hypothetical protein FACS189483_01310 [Spirochaetia bacterium]|nr:hypothetical protein FACS189483_01310 [Spirochaetia bacterium]